jgi:predicted AAA+ superfamily ATPase
MPLFSFADYIRITKDFPLLPYTFEDIITNHFQIAKEHSTWYSKVLFEEYLNYGEFGYFYEKTDDKILFNDRLDNAIKKSVFQDLPKFVDISTHNLSKVQELIYFLAEAGTSDISLNSLSKKINLSVKTTDIYISFLHKI